MTKKIIYMKSIQKKCVLLFFFLIFPLGNSLSQDFNKYQAKYFDYSEKKRVAKKKEKKLTHSKKNGFEDLKLKKIKKIVFSKKVSGATKKTHFIEDIDEGIVVRNLRIGKNLPSFQRKMAVFLKQPINLKVILNIKKEVARFYKSLGRPFVYARIEEKIKNGVLHFVVIESILGKIKIDNTSSHPFEPQEGWFKEAVFLDVMRNQSGQPINTQLMREDLDWVNQSPYRDVKALYQPGKEPFKTDVVLRVDDSFPLRPYIGIENNGTEALGETRFFTGLNYGNLWGMDHSLSYNFTTMGDFDFEKLTSHSMSYSIPIPALRSKVTLYGGVGNSNLSPEEIGALEIVSRSYSAGINLAFTLPALLENRLVHSVSLGYDFKEFGNYLDFLGHKISVSNLEDYEDESLWQVGQLTAQYYGNLIDSYGGTDFSLKFTWSPGGLAPHSKTAYLQKSGDTPNGTAHYWYTKIHLGRSQVFFAGTSLYGEVDYQYAPAELPPSERYGLGGFGTVRGYGERTISQEEALNVTAELRSMPLSPVKWFGAKNVSDALIFIGFFDYGMGNLRTSEQGNSYNYMMSAGVGFRYYVSPYLQSRLDLGWRVDNNVGVENELEEPQYSVTLFYAF